MNDTETDSADGTIWFEDGVIVVRATDLDVAEKWIDRYAATCRFDVQTGEWVNYERGVWTRLNGDAIPGNKFSELRKSLVAVHERNGKEDDATEWLNQGSRASSVLRNVSLDSAVQVRGDRFDQHPNLFNVSNGTLNLRSGDFLAHDPGHLLTQQAPVRFDPGASAPQFDKFIREVLPNDAVRGYVQRLFGMSMLGDVEEHILPVFVGEGRNGKGVLLEIMQELFGNYATGLQKNVLIETKFEEHSTILMTLKGRRLAVAQELDRNAKWDTATVKSLTGGDKITARRMRQDDETFSPSHTLVMATNHRPQVGDGEPAFWARYREIPFTVSFEGRADLTLASRIIANELPGVLNWVLAGLNQYLVNGRLDAPEEVLISSKQAREEGDPLLQFLADNYRITGDAADRVRVKELFETYQEWRRSSPSSPVLTDRTIRKRLLAAVNTGGSVTLGEDKSKLGALVTGLRALSGDDNASPRDEDFASKSDIVIPVTCKDDDGDSVDANLGLSTENIEVSKSYLSSAPSADKGGTSSPSSTRRSEAQTSSQTSSPANIVTDDPETPRDTVSVTQREGFRGYERVSVSYQPAMEAGDFATWFSSQQWEGA